MLQPNLFQVFQPIYGVFPSPLSSAKAPAAIEAIANARSIYFLLFIKTSLIYDIN